MLRNLKPSEWRQNGLGSIWTLDFQIRDAQPLNTYPKPPNVNSKPQNQPVKLWNQKHTGPGVDEACSACSASCGITDWGGSRLLTTAQCNGQFSRHHLGSSWLTGTPCILPCLSVNPSQPYKQTHLLAPLHFFLRQGLYIALPVLKLTL